jgi:hypothetical protein
LHTTTLAMKSTNSVRIVAACHRRRLQAIN